MCEEMVIVRDIFSFQCDTFSQIFPDPPFSEYIRFSLEKTMGSEKFFSCCTLGSVVHRKNLSHGPNLFALNVNKKNRPPLSFCKEREDRSESESAV